MGVVEFSIYLLSANNLLRSPAEVEAVSRASVRWIDSLAVEAMNFRVVHVGDSSLLPVYYAEALSWSAKATAKRPIRLNLLAAYDHAWEITQATQMAAADGRTDWQSFLAVTSTVDTVIRSGGGRVPLSGFLPVQTAYASVWLLDGSFGEIEQEVISQIISSNDVPLFGL